MIKFDNPYRNKLNYNFYCINCNRATSIYKNSIFKNINIDLLTIFLVLQYFIIGMSCKHTPYVLKLNGKEISTIQVYKYFYQFKAIIEQHHRNYLPLYEFSGEVEIDEVYLKAT
jgi:hypothetical protein